MGDLWILITKKKVYFFLIDIFRFIDNSATIMFWLYSFKKATLK